MAHITKRRPRFVGKPREAGLFHGFVHSGTTLPGMPMLVDAKTLDLLGFDPVEYAQQHVGGVNVKAFCVIGDQGCGKTHLVNVYCGRVPAISQRKIVSWNSLKWNAGTKPETYALATHLIGPSDTKSISDYVLPISRATFDPMRMHDGMSVYHGNNEKEYDDGRDRGIYHIRASEVVDEITMMYVSILEATGQKLTEIQHAVLLYELQAVFAQDGHSTARLIDALRTFDFSAFVAADTDYDESGQTSPGILRHFEADYLEAAHDLYVRLGHMRRGRLGQFLGGEGNTLLSQMELPMVSFDFKGANDDLKTVAYIILWTLRANAIQHNYLPRISFVNINDEAYEAWRNLAFARAMYLASKTLRERDAVEGTMLQRLRDMHSVSSSDSEQARYAENWLNEIPIWFIGRLPRTEWPLLKERFGLGQHILDTLPDLPTGFFWLIVGNLSPRLVFVLSTPEEIERYETNQALKELARASNAGPVLYRTYIERYREILSSLTFDLPEEEPDALPSAT